MSKAKQTKEEREQEFINAIEMILGFPLMEWQKPILLEVRSASLAGRQLNLNAEMIRKLRK